METTNRKKKIHGRIVPLVVLEQFVKPVKEIGSTGHVLVPRKYAQDKREAEIRILSPLPFVCKQCSQVISQEENFSPNPELCNFCYNGFLRLEELKKNNQMRCKVCHKPVNEKDFWVGFGELICPECILKKDEEEAN